LKEFVLAIAVAPPPQNGKDPSIDLLRFKNHDHDRVAA
jgi:hypothetical protein